MILGGFPASLSVSFREYECYRNKRSAMAKMLRIVPGTSQPRGEGSALVFKDRYLSSDLASFWVQGRGW